MRQLPVSFQLQVVGHARLEGVSTLVCKQVIEALKTPKLPQLEAKRC